MKGRKKMNVQHKFNKELWLKVNIIQNESFATQEQSDKITKIVQKQKDISELFIERMQRDLEEHPLKYTILLWLECTNPKTPTYSAVEKVAESFFMGEL